MKRKKVRESLTLKGKEIKMDEPENIAKSREISARKAESWIRRIYIDNYKCLVNFDCKLDHINLFLGKNGSGKTAVFEVLSHIQQFVCREGKVKNIFRSGSRTRWQNLECQNFELEIANEEGLYRYQLSVKHHEDGRRAEVKYERLFFEDKPLLRLEEGGQVYLYRDNFSQGPEYQVDRSFSAVGSDPPRNGNTRLIRFRERLSDLIIVQVIPPMMSGESPDETPYPSQYLENFTSWYRYVSQNQGMAFRLMSELKEVLPGFDHFRFEPVGEKHRLLKVFFRDEQDRIPTAYKFYELSDGQRMLIVLYTLLHAVCADPDRKFTLCLDEPENFLALQEIQPWLAELYDRCDDGETQALLISHHPEFINYLIASPIGCWFERKAEGPVRIRNMKDMLRHVIGKDSRGISVSEIITRGWLND